MISTQTPRRIRNPNLLARAIFSSVVAAFWAIVTMISTFALGWWMLVLLTGLLLGAAYCIAGWWLTTLTIDEHAVSVTDFDGSTVIPWHEIERFEILAPARRTLFMLSFSWWRDRARLVLREGSVLPVRAIQPWHAGIFGLWSSMHGHTSADRHVDALNLLVEQRGSRG